MQLRQTLQDIVCNIEIEESKFRIRHYHFPPIEIDHNNMVQLRKLPQKIQYEYINSKLLEFIYGIYFEGSGVTEENFETNNNEQVLKKIASKGIDWEFYEELEKNNKGQGWYHPSFHILRQEVDGSLIAEFDNGILQILRERHLPVALQSAIVNDAISIFLPSSFINKSRYRVTGDGFGGLPPAKNFYYTLLVYFNFSSEAAVFAMNCITTELNAIKLPFVFEVLHNPLNYRFYNSGILKVFSEKYDSKLYKKFILPLLRTIYEDNKSHFREEIPIFTKKIAPGIGLSERPNSQIKFRNIIDSEGSYCEFVADALIEAHQNQDNSSQSRMEYILRKFEKYGIDIERPYLNPNAEDIYTPLV